MKITNRIRVITLIVLIFLLQSCCKNKKGMSFKADPVSLSNFEKEFKEQEIKKYKLGLSLSGGGLRASLFEYGVLKKLYDRNIEIDGSGLVAKEY